MRAVLHHFIAVFVVINLAMGGVAPAMACHTTKAAMVQGCCCGCGQATHVESGAITAMAKDDCGCALKTDDGRTTSVFTLNNTPDKLQYTVIPAVATPAAAHFQTGLICAKSVREFCAFESPPLYKLTSSYLC